MEVVFSKKALQDLESWKKVNAKILKRIESLIEDIKVSPYSGQGKPEQLKHELSGSWSRRIDQRNRLIYTYDKDSNTVFIDRCKGHYS